MLSQFRGGSISKGSELQIEVAEFLWRDVQVGNYYLFNNQHQYNMELIFVS